MFNGKTHYKWPLSIAFCMLTGYVPWYPHDISTRDAHPWDTPGRGDRGAETRQRLTGALWAARSVQFFCCVFSMSIQIDGSWIYIYGYGSIPINTIFRGMNIHLPAILMWTTGVQGFDTLPYIYTHMGCNKLLIDHCQCLGCTSSDKLLAVNGPRLNHSWMMGFLRGTLGFFLHRNFMVGGFQCQIFFWRWGKYIDEKKYKKYDLPILTYYDSICSRW